MNKNYKEIKTNKKMKLVFKILIRLMIMHNIKKHYKNNFKKMNNYF